MASTAKAAARPPHSKLTFGFGGYVAFGELGAFAEKELLHLFFHYFLRAGIEGIEAVFVHDHFGVLDPELPGIFRNAFVDALAEFALPGWAIESGEVAVKFNAMHYAGAGLDRFICCGRCGAAGIVGHCYVLMSCTFSTIPQAMGNS